jgi:hypothetical protein
MNSVDQVVDRIKAIILPTWGIADFRDDPGGLLSHYGFTEDDETCKAAIERVLAGRAANVIFFELVPEYFGDETLPQCPDGSGDLWWDDASYIRYQAWDGPTYVPEHIVSEVDSPDYCDGVDKALYGGAKLCDRCRAAYDAQWPF